VMSLLDFAKLARRKHPASLEGGTQTLRAQRLPHMDYKA
jgi:hypothetical protein